MQTVWKFHFDVADHVVIEMPINADIVLVAVQPDLGPCIWAKVDTMLPTEKRLFRITATGAERPDNCWHLATFQQPPFVWHLWGTLEDRRWEEAQEFVRRRSSPAPRPEPMDKLSHEELWKRLSTLNG